MGLNHEELIILALLLVFVTSFASGSSPETNQLLVIPALLVAIPLSLFNVIASYGVIAGIAGLVVIYWLLQDNISSPLAGLAIFAFIILTLAG